MNALAARLRAEISAQGPLRFDVYMARVLFDPADGYYGAGRAQIGRGGDFYTNVSVGRMFGRVIAAQCAEVWERLERPTDFTFVEQGANDGRLTADVLDALAVDHPDCAASTRALLVEPFTPLAEAQRKTLATHASLVSWVADLAELPAFTGVHFTNEYADALPVRLFRRAAEGWLERYVTVNAEELTWEDHPTPDAHGVLPVDAPADALAETRPEAETWIQAVAARLTRGLMLVVDYGFPRADLYAPWRQEGTLSCYRGHRRDDNPLIDPGEKDLTAHVDFTGLAEAGAEAGFTVAGFADQYHFLVGAATPLLLRMEQAPASPDRDADLRAFKTLLHPETMGTQFKYLALTRGLGDLPLAGFRHARPAAVALGLD